MALGTFTNVNDLINAVEKWLDRNDLAGMVPDFCTLVEADLNRKLRTRSMESASTLSVTGGGSTAALPSDFLDARALVYTSGSTSTALEYFSPDDAPSRFSGDASGSPRGYTIIGDNVVVYPAADSTYTLALKYYAAITTINGATTANWVFRKHPDVYLYGALYHACVYTMDDKRKDYYRGLYEKAVEELNLAEDRAAHPSLKMRPSYQVY